MLDWHRLETAAVHRVAGEEGQVLLEYALVLALIAMVTIGALTALGVNLSGILNKVSSNMSVVSNP
jgi:Flp pilus assembly pilin Flp